jgi:acetamidase/formamidase
MEQAIGSEHRLPALRKNLHGTYHRANQPALQVESGDIINFETLEVGWRTERVVAGKTLKCILERHPVYDNGPALTGPVHVDGALPGMVLEVKFLSFQPVGWGWTSGGGPSHRIPALKDVEKEKASLFWDIDTEQKTVTNQLGQTVPYRPFLGCVGVASRDEERLPGWHPHPRAGGNLDANVLTVGSSLFLPVEVEGALLSVGDAHAAQGDGEVSGTAVECPMESARVQVIVHSDLGFTSPRALCCQRWVTFGIAETLDQASVKALEAMLDLITENVEISRSEALAVASSCLDLRVTQMVNPRKGIHAVLTVPLESLRPKR